MSVISAAGSLPGSVRSLWRFRTYGRRHLTALAAGILCRLIELVADLLQPWPLAIVVDSVIGHHPLNRTARTLLVASSASPTGLLAKAAAASLVLTAISGAFDYLGDRVMNSAGERMTASIRRDVFSRVTRAPLAWHDQQAVGELVSRVVTDTDRIEDALVDVFSTLVPGVVTIAGFVVVLVALEWRLALVAVSATPLVYLTAMKTSRANRQAMARRRAYEGHLASNVTEVLQGIRTVHIHASYDAHEATFGERNDETLTVGLRAVDLRARLTPLLEITAGLGSTAVLWTGGYGVLRGWWTVGLLLVVLAYLRNIVKPMRALARMSMTLARAAASADRVHTTLRTPISDRGGELPPRTRPFGRIVLSNVGLDYGRGSVLHDVSLTVEPGSRVALIGENGAGKSSLLALIGGLYRPTAGHVLVDGIDPTTLRPEQLARHIAVVPQDTFLFAGTILDNIRYARPDASDRDTHAASRAGLVDRFVAELPDGYATQLGEKGVGLSGGQRQRIGIARALLADAPIVLLDEPTSGLDSGAEADVVDALAALMAGRTVVMTTHRPALLDLAQVIAEVSDGKLIARTTRPAGPYDATDPQPEPWRPARALHPRGPHEPRRRQPR